MPYFKLNTWVVVLMLIGTTCLAQAPAENKDNDEIAGKAREWVMTLQLNDAVKIKKVEAAITEHLVAVRDWHNEHPASLIPDAINPATGNKLSQLDKEVMLCSAKPAAVHTNLMNVLNAELSPQQVEAVLDKYTIGKVGFTMKGYEAIIPDLTEKEKTEILKNLKQAREMAIDYKNMKEISAIFEIYKTKCEQYLNNNGRNWRQLYKTYTDKIKAEKKAKEQNK